MRSLLPVRGNLPGPSKIALALLILGAFFLPAPFVMLAPGTPQNILGEAIKISGTQIYPTSGKLSVTSVMVTDPDSYITGFDILYGWIDRSRAILPREEVYPDGETSADAAREGAAEMNSSQINATAAALSYLGIQSPSKLVIVDVNKVSKGYKVILPGDQILSIDDKSFLKTTELINYLGEKKPNDVVRVKFLRAGVEIIKDIELSARDDGSAYMGVNIQQQFDFP